MNQTTLTNRELASLCTELSLLLHSGVGVGDGLHLLAEEDGDPLALELANSVDSGMTLAAAMRKAGRFPVYVCALTEVGERAGRGEEALSALAEYYEENERLNQRIRSALLYPSILLLLMLAVIVVLLTRVLPVFNEVYASLGGQLTGVAGGLLAFGRVLDRLMPALCVLLAALVLLLAAFAASGAFRERLLRLWRRRRGDRGVSRAINTARFAQAMAMGMRSGLPLEESLTLASSLQQEVPTAAERCGRCRALLDQGVALAEALRTTELFTPADCRVLSLGVRSGTGDAVMQKLAERMSEDSRQELEEKVGWVEPGLVLVTSVLVGLILLSVMLPLMDIMAAIG